MRCRLIGEMRSVMLNGLVDVVWLFVKRFSMNESDFPILL